MAIEPSTAFVSYSREDWAFAVRVAKDLKAKGAKVWMDKLDIRPGQRWELEVEAALNGCSRLLVILSPASVGSSNVLAEAAFAIDEGKEVIPVLYLECKIPFRLRPFQYADFRTSYDEGLQELLATLESDRAAAKTVSPTAESTATPAAALTEREGKTAEEKKREEQLERQRLATEKARLEEERKEAAANKARLEQEERERNVRTFGTVIRASTRALRSQSVPFLITPIVGAILIVGWLIYRASSSSSKTPSAAPSSSPTTAGAAATVGPVDSNSAISGTVRLSGTLPTPHKIDMSQDPACRGSDVVENIVVSGANLENVFVYVKEGLNRTFDIPKEAVILDQSGCKYHPHVLGVMAGQTIKILNSDPTTHNIHPIPKDNREWNESQPPQSAPLEKVFAREEIMLLVKCNLHPWMKMYFNVTKNPFYAVTGLDGKFEIKGLPPGNYTIAFVHEKLGEQDQKVALGPDDYQIVDQTFPLRP